MMKVILNNIFLVLILASCFRLSGDNVGERSKGDEVDRSNTQKERSHHGVIDYRTFLEVGMEENVPSDEHITITTLNKRILYSGSAFALEQKKKILLPFKQKSLQVSFKKIGKTILVKLDNNQLRIGY